MVTSSDVYPDGFHISFDDGSFADCTVLEPGSKNTNSPNIPWIVNVPQFNNNSLKNEYHLPPEIFISQGSPNSIVNKWVKENGNGLHHVALLVDSVEETQKEWIKNGFAEFCSDKPTKCPGLTQIFSKPSSLTGFIWELIEREEGEDGFCYQNVKTLMESSTNKHDKQ